MVGSRVRVLTGYEWVIPSYLYLNGPREIVLVGTNSIS